MKGLRKLFINSLLVFLFFSIVIVGVFTLALDELFFNVWDYYHDGILIPLFWRVIPCVIVLYAAMAANPLLKSQVLKFFGSYERKFHVLSFGIVAVTLVAAVGQTLGGCIWQIPNILMGDPEYAWKRFGYAHFPPDVLMAFYFSASVLLWRLLKHIFFQYILSAKQEDSSNRHLTQELL